MQIIPLSEGRFTIDKTKIFVPFDSDIHDLQERPTGSLLVEIQPFVIITEKDIILLDTGLGFTNANGQLQLHENLLKHGIEPSKVTKVLLSHLHKDHAGGIGYKLPGQEKSILSFPGAIYYVNKREWDFAQVNETASYITDDFNILINSENLQLISDEGMINESIRFQMSGGHCPYHTVFWVHDEGEVAFFGADVSPQLQQMKNKFVAKYDYDGKLAMELRQKWWQKGNEQHWRFLFYHDIKTPVFHS